MVDASIARSARRGRLQLILSMVFVGLAALAVVVPTWIEAGTGLEPDHGNGDLEMLLAVAFGIAAVASGALAWRTRRRLARQSAGS